jgi:hypothetical protein
LANTAVPSDIKRRSKAQRLRELAELNGWNVIGEAEWNVIVSSVPGVKTEDVRLSGLAALPPWRGVARHTLQELEQSLLEMTTVYESQPEHRQFCRNEVIRAKDRARIISRSKPEKLEMVEWMLVWLGDPSVFPAWMHVRKKIISPH